MSDINEFVKKMSDDINTAFAPKVRAQVIQTGHQIADNAAPQVNDFVGQLVKEVAAAAGPKVRELSDKLVKDIITQQSGVVSAFITKIVQDLIARYEPVLAGNVHSRIVEQGIVLTSDDTRVEIKERATGRAVASLDLPVDFHIVFKDAVIHLEEATFGVEHVP
jgi:chaperonin GroEL (HSP60 family)